MLNAARGKAIYRELVTSDLNERIDKKDGAYHVTLCVGTFTKGHVDSKALTELVRVTASHGLTIVTVHDEIWENGGYRAEIDRMQDEGIVQITSIEDFGVVDWTSSGAKMVVLTKV
jgi:hypothetical protein